MHVLVFRSAFTRVFPIGFRFAFVQVLQDYLIRCRVFARLSFARLSLSLSGFGGLGGSGCRVLSMRVSVLVRGL